MNACSSYLIHDVRINAISFPKFNLTRDIFSFSREFFSFSDSILNSK
jgi:hypothetical protein